MPYKDPEVRKRKHAEYSRANYEKNKPEIIKRVKLRKKLVHKRFLEYKLAQSCIECGESHVATLDFHHVNPQKTDRKLHSLVRDGHLWGTIAAEIAKCVVLCANCHRKHHHNERHERKRLVKAKKKGNIHTVNTQKAAKNAGRKEKIPPT